MDAKSKANFINSVASGQVIPCPVCGIQNTSDSRFCISCGSNLKATSSGNTVPVFAQVADNPAQSKEATVKYKEPDSVFADGLPSWDIVPPQVMVRRR